MNEYYSARLYLQDSHLITISSQEDPNIAVRLCEKLDLDPSVVSKYGASTHKLVLTKTIFHPQGGGQPSDQGIIEVETEDGSRLRFLVNFVQSNSTGEIEHFGQNAPQAEEESHIKFTDFFVSASNPPLRLHLSVNGDLRRKYSHLHSVGHMLDAAMNLIGYGKNKLQPTKGYHFVDGPYVEYEIVDADTLTAFTSKQAEKLLSGMASQLQHQIQELIANKIETIVSYVPSRGSEGENSSEFVRIVNVAGCECPCGGTHVSNTEEINESVNVTKIKRKKSTLKVSYQL